MGQRNRRKSTSMIVRLVMVALLTPLLGSAGSVSAAETVQEAADGGPWSMGIFLTAEGATYPGHIDGARYVVTSEDGTYIGECTLGLNEWQVPWWNCRVDVPSDRVSLVWLDLESIPAGYAPVENPIVFDPTTHMTAPHNIGASFVIVPQPGGDSPVAALIAALISILQTILASLGR